MVFKIILSIIILFVSYSWLAWAITSVVALYFFNTSSNPNISIAASKDTFGKTLVSLYMLISFLTSSMVLYLNFKSIRFITWKIPFVVKKPKVVWFLSLLGLFILILNEVYNFYNNAPYSLSNIIHPFHMFALQGIIFGYIFIELKRIKTRFL